MGNRQQFHLISPCLKGSTYKFFIISDTLQLMMLQFFCSVINANLGNYREKHWKDFKLNNLAFLAIYINAGFWGA